MRRQIFHKQFRLLRWLFLIGVFFSVTNVAFATAPRDVVVNEIAWMGTSDANDEWLELKNNTDAEIALAGFTLTADDGTPTIALAGTISARGYFLLERTDDTSVNDISADQLYTGALGNTGEILILRDAGGNEIDRVDAWHAGDNSTKKTMERRDPTASGTDAANWATNDGVTMNGTDVSGNPILGTPKSQNSVYFVEDGSGGDGGGGDEVAPTTSASPAGGVYLETQDVTLSANELVTIYYTLDGNEPTLESSVYATPISISTNTILKFFARDEAGNSETPQTLTYSFASLKINEFVSAPSVGAEWVEIYNSSDAEVNLASVTLSDNTGVIKTFGAGDTITAYGYFVAEFTNKLNNSGDTLILRAPLGATLDSLAYGDYDDGDASDNLPKPNSNEALARRPDGSGTFFLVPHPTKNSANPNAPTLADSVVVKINEVDFKNSVADRAELLILDDGNGGGGVDLGGFYFSDDTNFKTIADGTLARTGDLLVLTFNSSAPDEVSATDGVLQLFTTHSGLVGTDEQIILRDGLGTIEDAVAWASANPSAAEITDLENLISANAWSGAAFSSASVPNNYTIARSLDSADTDTSADFRLAHATLGAANSHPNEIPNALITTQSASSCSLSINLDGSTSSDPDGDALSYFWDFGDGATNYSENPGYQTYATAGTYAVSLTVTDALGATHSATQSFTVAKCGSAAVSKIIPPEEILESLPAWKVKLLITEVAFNSEQDFVEVFVADDGSAGAGVDLGGFYFDDGKRVKTLPRGTLLRTGEYLVLYFKSDLPDESSARGGILHAYTEKDGLVKTDKSIALRDSRGMVEDAVVWSDHGGAWTRGVEAVVTNLVYAGAWNSASENAALDSSTIERGVSFARKPTTNNQQPTTYDERLTTNFESETPNSEIPNTKYKIPNTFYADTNSASDFFATPFPTPGVENRPPPLTARDVTILLTRIAPKNPDGDEIEFVCTDCGEGKDLSGFFLKFNTTKIFTFPEDFTLREGEKVILKNDTLTILNSDGVQNSRIENLKSKIALTGTDGLLTLKDYANTTEDFVCYTDRLAPPSRAYDLALAEVTQLEKRFREGEWNSENPNSCLDSRLVERGGSIARRNKEQGIKNKASEVSNPEIPNTKYEILNTYFDTNSASDWEILPPSEKLLKIVPMTSDSISLSEILPNPNGVDAGVEWVELVNLGTTPVELFGWSLAAGRGHFVFEDSVILAPGEYRAFPGALVLPNAGSTVTLTDPFKKILDTVAYPALAEGEAYFFDGANWRATSAPTPNFGNVAWKILAPRLDADRDGVSDAEELIARTDPQNHDTDGDGLPDGFELAHGLDPLVSEIHSAATWESYRRILTGVLASSLRANSESANPVALSGIGVPGGSVTIYVQSELRVISVAVDENGKWSYALDEFLERGEHNVFVQLADRDGFTSIAKKVLTFTLADDFTPPVYPTITFSEVLPNPSGRDAESEWLEIQNPNSELASLADFQLRVNGKNFVFPASAEIPAHGFLLLVGNQFVNIFNSSLTLNLKNFSLPNAGATLELLTPNGRIVSRVRYEKMKEGVAFAWDGKKFALTSTPTPGVSNQIVVPKTSTKKSATPKYRNGNLSTQILISEVLPNPFGNDAREEWVELVNLGATSVNLGNWQLDDTVGGSKSYVIPDTFILRPGEYRVFSRSVTKLALNNSGREEVRLFDFRGNLISSLSFRDTPEGIALARDVDGEYRATRILTAGKANVFDTEKLVGKILFVAASGFVLRTATGGEFFIAFADDTPSRLARALLTSAEHAEIYARKSTNGFVLADFRLPDSGANFVTPDLGFSVAQMSAWLALLIGAVFGMSLFVRRTVGVNI